MTTEISFEPEITAFYCIYCGYMAADTAGALGVQYPANVKFIRLPCTGKTDIRYILEAFEQGADGVYIIACPIGNCHHVRGNERGRSRVRRARQLLEEIGMESDRLGMFFMSGSQAHAFSLAAKTMTERIRKLGPNPLKREKVLIGDIESPELDSEEDSVFRGRR
ncbi:MAG TPA: hydrogenase iron-sulfur subunit [Anaerolineales bacterium]|nr:hydrogenase iron-sulfur subunit [Anaerolineales bacterium]